MQPNTDWNPCPRNRGRRTPRCGGEHGDIITSGADLPHCSKKRSPRAFAASRCAIPKWIGRDDVGDSWYESGHVGRVFLAPDVQRCLRKTLAQRRRERGREHHVTQVIETDEENTVDGHATTKLTSAVPCSQPAITL